MNDIKQKTGVGLMLNMAGFVIVLAGMKVAKPILVPFLLAIFLAVICTPALFWLQRQKVPKTLAVTIVVVGIILIGVLISHMLGTSLISFTQDLPSYETRLDEEKAAVLSWLNNKGIKISNEIILDAFEPKVVMKLIADAFTGLGNVLTNAFMILLMVVFILLEISSIPSKLRRALGKSEATFPSYKKFIENLNHYMALKTLISLATGIVITIWLKIIGIDYALLWGILAFLLNYIPNIGSIIAAVPVVILGYIQLGWWPAFLVALGYLVVNVLIGQVIEPRVMGKGMNLSTLVVFLSLVVWGWVLGPVGMFLSVPITMTLKIALESREDTRWISTLLGAE